jgi:calcineurin-like phosphoesterase
MQFNALLVEIDPKTAKAIKVKQIRKIIAPSS